MFRKWNRELIIGVAAVDQKDSPFVTALIAERSLRLWRLKSNSRKGSRGAGANIAGTNPFATERIASYKVYAP